MAYAFDSLGYAKRLRDGGVPQDQAEAHAEAARDFIMAELVTKTDLLATEQKLQTELHHAKQELQSSIDTLSLRLTVRLGAIVVVGIGALAAILKLA